MTNSAPDVSSVRWAVFKIDRGRAFQISKDFREFGQAEDFVSHQPTDWQLEIRKVAG